MKKLLCGIFVLSAIYVSSNLKAQSTADKFNIIFENDYNDNQTGTYVTPDFADDWNIRDGGGPVGNVQILNDDAEHQKMMRAYFPTGTMEPTNEHGFTWYSWLSSKQEEMYFSYDLRFKPGFEGVHGGKIPGLVGGSVTSGQLPTESTGFSVRPCWKGGGTLVFYVYHHDQSNIYGDIYYFEGFRFETGRWYNLTMRIVLNSVVDGTAKADGILEGYIDGKLMFQMTGFRYRLNSGIKIERMYLCSFFGGNTPEWATIRDEWIDFDNFVDFTYTNYATGVPRGLQLSSFDKPLLHPYKNFTGGSNVNSGIPAAPSGLAYSLLSKSSVTLKWSDNSSNEEGFKIYRSASETGEFSEVADLSSNTTSFADNSLQPGTSYYYKMLAYNQNGNSAYTPVYQITTTTVDLPSPPWDLSSTKQTGTSVNLSWKENSTRENGFELHRSNSESDGFVKVESCPANTTSCVNENLQPGKTYYYKVRAFNTDGYSNFSNVLKVATTNETVASPNTVYIDPGNTNDVSENGTLDHPFDSWSDISWKEGYAYLQKRGTATTVDQIKIGANHITMGAYGEGNSPSISSQTTTYLINGFEKSGIQIRDLELKADKAASCIYFMGNSDSITVEHTLLTSGLNAIKVLDAATLTVKHSRIMSKAEGIFTTARNNSFYYNIFESCNTAVNLSGSTGKAEIFNNVFAHNGKSIAGSFAELALYNNIFYASGNTGVALELGTVRTASDNNIFYPEHDGFITVAGKKYNKLSEVRQELKTDLKSIAADPLFVDSDNGNYKLSSKSPALNSGRNMLQNADIEGNKVPIFNLVDIGAYEFDGNLNKYSPDIDEQASMIVYPNPSTGQFTLEGELKEGSVSDKSLFMGLDIRVLDISGKLVFSKRILMESENLFKDKIDLSGSPNGLYFVIMSIGDISVNRKLIIQK